MTWRVESSPSASSTRTGILGSIGVSLLDPSAAAASASSSSPSPSSESTTFTTSSAPLPISTSALLLAGVDSDNSLPDLSLFSHSAVGSSRHLEVGSRKKRQFVRRTTKPKRRSLYTCTRPLPQTSGPRTRWPGRPVGVGAGGRWAGGLELPRGHEISAAIRPVAAPATSVDRADWPTCTWSAWSHDDVAGAWSVVGIFPRGEASSPIFSRARIRGRPGDKGPDLRPGQRHVVGRGARAGGSCGRAVEVGCPPVPPLASSGCGLVDLWCRAANQLHWWTAFRLGRANGSVYLRFFRLPVTKSCCVLLNMHFLVIFL
jgi:hypothetical protein